MKKQPALLFALLITLMLSLPLAACGKTGTAPSKSLAGQSETIVSASPEPEATSSKPEKAGATALVVYFSCTGNTKAVAETIAKSTGADIYEIVPKTPYTDEDIDYRIEGCRANLEMNDKASRPAISGKQLDLSDYDTIYLGFPIWWGTAPKIINTFLDTYVLSGKTVMPFCTTGGSGISTAVSMIRNEEPDATVTDGLLIGSSRADNCGDAVADWLAKNGRLKVQKETKSLRSSSRSLR